MDRCATNGGRADLEHQPGEDAPEISAMPADLKHLRAAAPVTAAAWFTMRGCKVSFPTEPAVYDLLVDTPQGFLRVQVKTTTSIRKEGWVVGVGHHPDTHSKKGRLLAYDPDEIDVFFIMDGDMAMYLIPSRALAGRVYIVLRKYRKYMVGNAQGLLGVVALDTIATDTAADEKGSGARVPA